MQKGIIVVGIHTSSWVLRCPRLPSPGEYILGNNFRRVMDGGKASNQALAVSLLGGQSYLVARVGNDDEGKFAVEYLKDHGVNTDYISVSDTLPSGMGMAFMDLGGIPMGATVSGANSELSEKLILMANDAFERSGILLAQLEAKKELVFFACKLAKEKGAIVILDPAPADGFSIKDDCRYVDILTPNEPEAKMLSGYETDEEVEIEEVAEKLYLLSGKKIIIITLGGKGVYVRSTGLTEHICCPRVKTVDTSGAGDCFNAGLAVSLARGKTLSDSILYSLCAASLSVQKDEVWTSYPNSQEVDKLLYEEYAEKNDME